MSIENWTTRILVGSAKNRETVRVEPAFAGDESTQLGPTPEAAGSSLVGRRIGVYQITKRLGAGGVGEVFKGTDTMLKREVAIKILRDELASDPVFLARFRNEAQLQAKLSHENVASVHAFLQEGDKQLLVMEYVPGISLDEFVRSGGPVPVERALAIFRRVLDGIEHAHGHGIVHRDIKPANIMLADSGQVKVMDFGIARAMDSQEQLTRFGHVAGTAKAMSPEQIRGQKADVRSDIYSLGIVLYTLLAGRAPFDSGNDVELMKAQLEQTPPPLRGAIDKVPAPVEAAVMRALEKDPAVRFQTVREFARAIDACNLGSVTRPPTAAARADATASRTAINPALQGVKHLPPGGDERAEPKAGTSAPRSARMPWAARPGAAGMPWARLAAVTLGVLALGGGAALLWSQFGPGEAPPPVTPRAAGSGLPQATAPAPADAAPAATPSAAEAAATPSPAAAVQPDVTSALAAPQAHTDNATPAPTEPAPAPTTDAVAAAPAIALPPSTQVGRMPTTLAIARLGAAAGSVSATGHRYRPGERVQLLITPSRDAHVYCYLQDETRRIQRFFPNRFRQSALVRTSEPLRIPGGMRFELVANSLRVPETVACFASERDVRGELPAAVLGSDFDKLAVASLEDLQGAFARAAGDSLAQASFRVHFK